MGWTPRPITEISKGDDMAFAEFMDCFGAALGKSRNLDGRQTDWNRQFWAMVRERVGNTMAEFNSPLFRQSLFLHPKG